MIIVNFIIVFASIVLIHELGHFVAAKMFGIQVEAFSIGFGPRLFGRKKGYTDYRVSLIPLGGYVKMDQKSHDGKKIWQRVIVSFSGPAANLIFALVVFIAVHASGVPSATTRIGALQQNKPAIQAGVAVNDVVTFVNGKPVKFWDDFIGEIAKSTGGVYLIVTRDGNNVGFSISPEIRNGKAFIGVAPSGERLVRHYSLVESLHRGVKRWWREITNFSGFLSGFATGDSSASDVGGPVAIASAANKAAQAGIMSLMLIIAVLSISLGMFNLIPIPVLDGGAILLYLYEALAKRSVAPKVLLRLNQAGIVSLSILMAWAFLNDLGR